MVFVNLQTVMAADRIPATVVKVYDGDTLLCRFDGREEKVRLIGVDCPESSDNSKHRRDERLDCCHNSDELIEHGKKAKEFTEHFAGVGKMVELELDVQERDVYGRVLAYVWVDGDMLNSALLREGHAKLMTVPPNVKRSKYFYKLQKEAQDKKVGVWG